MNRQRYLGSQKISRHLTTLKALPLSDPKGRLLAECVAAVSVEATAWEGQQRAFYDSALALVEHAFALGDLAAADLTVSPPSVTFAPHPLMRVVVADGRGNGLFAHEVCAVGTCCRPPGHEGRHDQFDGPQSADAVPLHPIPEGP